MNNEITAVSVKGQFNVDLAKNGIVLQKIADERTALVLNEDNITEIKAWLDKSEKAQKQVETSFKNGKEAINKAAKIWSNERKAYLDLLLPDYDAVHLVYSELCRNIQQRELEQEQEEKRLKDISDGINNNIMEYSRRISEATTIEQLSAIQSSINLQRTQEKKYGDQLDAYCLRLDELNPLLKTKRQSIQQIAGLGKESDEAIHAGNDETVFELETKKDELQEKVNEINTKVYETAGKNYSSAPVFVKSILPEVKSKRKAKSWEVVDIQKFAKKYPDKVTTSVNPKDVDELMKQYASEKKFTENSEAVIDGIKYFYKKTY